ncbi:MAG: hypothetical protein H0X67_04390 [Acidobacteria bacterium]|nr:hypothetical protein [Acidobacteriota bacterium]
MMIPERPSLERRVLAALDGSAGGGTRIPILLGGCGTGRTSLLLRLRDLLGRTSAQYINVEAVATTPERFLKGIRDASPFPAHPYGVGAGDEPGARESFDAALAFLDTARAPGDAPATFLLDEFLELRTFESFPGLRTVLRDLLAVLGGSGNRFVLSTRYVARAHRLLRDAPTHFELIHVPRLTIAEVRATMPSPWTADGRRERLPDGDDADRALDEHARLVHALSDGRPQYARHIAEVSSRVGEQGAPDPFSALSALLAPDGALAAACRFSYELRLHRARGYGALKAILEVLAEEESLTLTEIAIRLRRTPGSTKDYLSWLEDVDLIVSRQKRYSFSDPMLRVWVKLYGRPTPPTDEDLAREVHGYVLARLPGGEPALALAGAAEPERDRSWGIIEID